VVVAVGAITWIAVASGDDDGSSAVVEPKDLRNGGPRAGDVAPDFTLKTLDGRTVSLSDYRGKPVVLNFWASYCHPCREEFPLFREQLAADDGGFVVLGVDVKDIESDAEQFAEKQKATWPIVVDPSSAVAKAYGVAALPQTFFIRPDGTVALRYYAKIPDAKWASAVSTITG
jgi:cytochrome c biogenesis protein CcmG/thiol:disulfide interchange protein DsbE